MAHDDRGPGTSERRRVAVSAIAGLVAGGVAGFLTVWQLALLIGWSLASITLLAWIWFDIGNLDAATTAHVATREDDSRTAAGGVLVGASVLSLIANVAGLHRSSDESSSLALEIALTSTAVLAVALSWIVVHTVFVLRYAHLYYGGAEPGGIDFPGGDRPSYRDFAYIGFTVGMTFQVSDTGITDPVMRRTVLRQALLSYFFSLAIIALTINVIAGLIS
jgi:uncharacterized membrane protein